MKIFLIVIINLILTSSLALASEKLGEAVCSLKSSASLREGAYSMLYEDTDPFQMDFDERISRSTIVEVNTFKNVTIFREEKHGKVNEKESYFIIGSIDKNNNKYTYTEIHFTLENMERSEQVRTTQNFFSCLFLE